MSASATATDQFYVCPLKFDVKSAPDIVFSLALHSYFSITRYQHRRAVVSVRIETCSPACERDADSCVCVTGDVSVDLCNSKGAEGERETQRQTHTQLYTENQRIRASESEGRENYYCLLLHKDLGIRSLSFCLSLSTAANQFLSFSLRLSLSSHSCSVATAAAVAASMPCVCVLLQQQWNEKRSCASGAAIFLFFHVLLSFASPLSLLRPSPSFS